MDIHLVKNGAGNDRFQKGIPNLKNSTASADRRIAQP